jgi:hypothetical protein
MRVDVNHISLKDKQGGNRGESSTLLLLKDLLFSSAWRAATHKLFEEYPYILIGSGGGRGWGEQQCSLKMDLDCWRRRYRPNWGVRRLLYRGSFPHQRNASRGRTCIELAWKGISEIDVAWVMTWSGLEITYSYTYNFAWITDFKKLDKY